MQVARIIDLQEAVQSLNRGAVGVIPTDTVYGLVARAQDPAAVARLYALKNRERKPGTIIAANEAQLLTLGISETHISKVAQWWPGPLSVVLPLNIEFAYLHQSVGDIAVRIADDSKLQELLEQTGPLLSSSANLPNEPTAATIREGWDYFKDSIDFYVDGGDLKDRPPSTIIRMNNSGDIEVLRHGAVALRDMVR